LAKGIAVFTAKHGDAIIDVKTKNGDFRVERIQSRDASEVAKALSNFVQRGNFP
jgi:hypothetical protein